MILGKKVALVMPAFRAEKTLEDTWNDVPKEIVDFALLVDDASDDETVRLAETLGINVVVHEENRGYGANQKTCYTTALGFDPDIVVMLHPDYQYDPRLLGSMVSMIASGVYGVVIGSRILGGGALSGGMPLWKYIANRILTLTQNLLLGAKLSEYHTGYRAFSSDYLRSTRWEQNSDDFVFDNQMLTQAILAGYDIGEISVPTRYFEEASSINLRRSIRYGFGVLGMSLLGFLHRTGLHRRTEFTRRGSHNGSD